MFDLLTDSSQKKSACIEYLKNNIGVYGLNKKDVDVLIEEQHIDKEILLGRSNTQSNHIPSGSFEALINHFESILNNREFLQKIKEKKGKNIALKDLLNGDEGVALFEKAIEEEAESENLRFAILQKATNFYDNPNFIKPFAMFVAGKSASGKTYSGINFVKQKLQNSKNVQGENQVPGPDSQNDNVQQMPVTGLDGGDDREGFLVRKAVIFFAMAQGLTGVTGLGTYDNKFLKPVQKARTEAVANSKVSVLIPETFSFGPRLLFKIRNLFSKKSLEFSTVKTDNEPIKKMGKSRAFASLEQVKEFENFQFNVPLHQLKLPECKAPGGFFSRLFGAGGSWIAEKVFKRLNPQSECMTAETGLSLMKKNPKPNHPEQYVSAKAKDKSAFLVSKRDFADWKTHFSEIMDLTVFNKGLTEEVWKEFFKVLGRANAVAPFPQELKGKSLGVSLMYLSAKKGDSNLTLDEFLLKRANIQTEKGGLVDKIVNTVSNGLQKLKGLFVKKSEENNVKINVQELFDQKPVLSSQSAITQMLNVTEVKAKQIIKLDVILPKEKSVVHCETVAVKVEEVKERQTNIVVIPSEEKFVVHSETTSVNVENKESLVTVNESVSPVTDLNTTENQEDAKDKKEEVRKTVSDFFKDYKKPEYTFKWSCASEEHNDTEKFKDSLPSQAA